MAEQVTGVRLQCPTCTLSVVMVEPGVAPEPCTELEDGVPACPNCKVLMVPVGSAPVTEEAVREAMAETKMRIDEAIALTKNAIEQVSQEAKQHDAAVDSLESIREAEREVSWAKSEWDRAKEMASDAKKAYDGKVITLCARIRSLTAKLPLFDAQPGGDVTNVDTGEVVGTMVLPTGDDAPKGPASISYIGDALLEQTRLRLQAEQIEVTLDQVKAWTAEEYQSVVDYIEWLEFPGEKPALKRPSCLPAEEARQLPLRNPEPAEV